MDGRGVKGLIRSHRMKFRPMKVAGKPFPDSVESPENYIIHRCRAEGVPTGRIIAFRRNGKSGSVRVVGGYENSDAAKQACIDDFMSNR